MKQLLALAFIFIVVFNESKTWAQIEKLPEIIPAPVSFNKDNGFFQLSSKSKIIIIPENEILRQNANYLIRQVEFLTGIKLTIDTKNLDPENSITLTTGLLNDNTESYHLKITSNSVLINGATAAGMFYGIQSFLQFIPPKKHNKVKIERTEIFDQPTYSWRGMHLDVSRHFFPVSFIKKMLDQMAMLKLNTFHWHLTDDQGWRIEIKCYPKLTEIGGWRKESMLGHYRDNKFDGTRYGGFYSQDDVKEVVKYASERYITVVPEIEMPGHAVAALAAHPEYSCTGGPFEVYTKWGISEDVFCAGKEGTFEFLQNILDEVISLFPGQYIHVGGDECPKIRWKACADCQKRIKNNHLKDELELQSYFIKRIEKYIASKGKKLIGWDEILEGGLPERAAVMSWRGYKGGIEASNEGHDVVMTPTDYCYFDYYQGPEKEEPLAIGGYVPLAKVYSFNPLPPDISDQAKKHILGAQANVWTEYMANEKQVEYMVFPRICAMAEVLWTPRQFQDYSFFLYRLNQYSKRLEKYQIHYRSLTKTKN